MRWWVGEKGCKICGHLIIYDEWEDGSRDLYVFCEAEHGEVCQHEWQHVSAFELCAEESDYRCTKCGKYKSEEKEEGEDGRNKSEY